MKSVTLERNGDYLDLDLSEGTGWGDLHIVSLSSEFKNFDGICERLKRELGRELLPLECVNIQAMLGSNSIRKMTLGPGAQMHYERIGGS